MVRYLRARGGAGTVPITPLTKATLKKWSASQPERVQAWIESSGFKALPGSVGLLPGELGTLERVLFGVGEERDLWDYAVLPERLPEGRYAIDDDLSQSQGEQVALSWALSTYSFDRYRKNERHYPSLLLPKQVDGRAVERAVEAVFLVRDLINTPASDMGPAELAEAAQALGKRHKAKVTVTEGEQLLKKNYPAIHAVGRASSRAPCLIDMTWGKKGPHVTLVGKGVCFDSGGLDLKSASGMKLMKKDMGGAAHVLGLASMLMAANLPLRLRVLIPAVENSVSGDAFRPLDVLRTRKGLTVEVGNTDAEGRLVLCDALAAADEEKPDLLIDFATLTGAARVALGTDLPALFCNDGELAAALIRHGEAEQDPLWRMPLHQPYKRLLESRVADLNNVSDGPYAGAITAALFLEAFIRPQTRWAHIDLMAWNTAARPGRPAGGEAMGMRAVAAAIAEFVTRKKAKGQAQS
jgi:leucyl aminopeptidase